jgi:hypothetical protein
LILTLNPPIALRRALNEIGCSRTHSRLLRT